MVANRQPSPKQGTIQDLINGLLDRGYNNMAQPVLNAVTRSVNGEGTLIQQRLKELDAEVARLAEAGERLTPDNPVLRALLADLDDTMKVNARVVDGGAEAVQQTGINAADRIQRQLTLGGATDAQLRGIGIVWNKPDPEAVAQLINYTQSQAWVDTLEKYGSNVVDIVRNQAIRGIAEGWSPLRTASNVRQITENMPGYTANALMRTLQLTSYRDATAASQNANSDLASRVILIEALDDRTCLACIDRHGQVIWDSEEDAGTPIPRVDDHWNGRGTSVMEVKGRPLDIQTGRDWFNNLPPERQQQQGTFADSPAAWEAFQSGQVQLSDFVHVYEDPLFGSMVRESSLADALAGNNNNPFAEEGPRQVATINGYMEADKGSPGDTEESLNAFLDNSHGPLAQQILDFEMGLTTLDFDTGAVAVDPDGVKAAAKRFVRESQDIQYGKDYLLSLVQEQAAANGVDVSGSALERLYNSHYAYQARAVLDTANIAGVKLTDAQLRRLTEASIGNYLNIVYTTASSEAGSLANAALGGYSQGVMTAAARKEARLNFLRVLGRID